MAMGIVRDREHRPDVENVRTALGYLEEQWFDLKQRLASEFDPVDEQWVYSGRNRGWSRRLKRRRRAVVYLTPCDGFFRASFALGEKAAAPANDSRLPADLKTLIEQAPKYAEGRAVRIEVHGPGMVPHIVELARIKMAH